MADFQKALKKILKFEGGWSEDPRDKGNANGGATNKGITLQTFQFFYGLDKTKEDLKNITDEQVQHIYKSGYWDRVQGDKIENQSLAELIFDFVVNSGVGRIADIQRVIGVASDGIVGKNTLYVLNKTAERCFTAIWEYRKEFYERIVKKNPSQKIFLKGWENRLNSFLYEE